MQRDEWTPPISDGLPEPEFLSLSEVEAAFPDGPPTPAGSEFKRYITRPPPQATIDEGSEQNLPEASEVLAEGFRQVRLAAPINAPVQFFNDAVEPSVVEAIVAPNGLVVSARLLEMSGSKRADSDALSLARSARFVRLDKNFSPGSGEVEIGKLIFDWHALDFSQTNAVRR
jgi:hypothetical protein